MAFKTQLFWIIDIMNTLNKSKKGAHKPLKRLVYLLTLSGFTTSSLGGTFPTTPLHLQDETKTTTAAGVAPNIMLFIDDSGSMKDKANDTDTQTKIEATKSALNQVLTDSQARGKPINWGFQSLWGNHYTTPYWGCIRYNNNGTRCQESGWLGGLKKNLNNMDGFTSDYSVIQQHVDNLYPGGGTPTTARYFQVQDIVRNNIKNRCQQSYIVLMSDGDANLSCSYGKSTSKYNLKNFWEKQTVGDVSMDSNYLLPVTTLITKEHETLFGTRNGGVCQNWNGGSGVETWDRNDGLQWFSKTLFEKDLKQGGNDAWGESWDDESSNGKYAKQNIVTYTVGFGSGLTEEGKAYLQKGASPKDASKPNGAKHFYNAIQPKDLVAAFNTIFNDIDNNNQTGKQEVYSATAPAISSNYVDGLAAAASLNTGSWSSEILFYDVDANGRLDTSKPMRASFYNRQLLISNGNGRAVNLYSNTINSATNASYNITNNVTSDGKNNNTEWRDGLLKWMARKDTDTNIKSSNANFTLDYRVRTVADSAQKITDQRSMGDIIDNSILAIGEMKNKRQEFVVTATNDGMVYVFQSQDNKTNPYDLKFNYAPTRMERLSNDGSDYVGKYYKDTTRAGYGQDSASNPHRFLLNGGMVARSTDKGGKGKQIFVASTMGQAGRGAFAINVGGVNRATGAKIAANNLTNTKWHEEVQLFETSSGSSNQLGFTIGSPQIGRVQVDSNSTATQNDTGANIHYGVFVSNGYNYKSNYANANSTYADTPALYVYEGLGQDVGLTPTSSNYTKGEVLKKINVSNGSGGLATPTLVDVNFDGVIDYAYAGDYGGGLYRFNLTSPNPNLWAATKIFQTANNQPITSAPAVFRNNANKYTVIVGTGSEIYQEDLAAKNQQALYGIFDDLALKDHSAEVSTNDLLIQTLKTDTVSNTNGPIEIRKSSNNPIDETRHKGWQINLDATNGERITVKPSIMGNSVLLATRVYEQTIIPSTDSKDPCLDQTTRASSSAYSWLMQFNTSNGGLIPADNKSVYIDFNLGSDARFTSNANLQYMISGQKLHNLTSITMIDRLVEGFSASTSGDSGGSGEDAILNPNAKIPKNTCVGEGSKAFTFDTAGQSETYNIFGACRDDAPGYKRLSWREIF